MIVVDTNVVVYLLIDGPFTAEAARVLRKDPSWVVPPLLSSELRHVLVRTVGGGILDPVGARALAEEAGRMTEARWLVTTGPRILELALASGCSAYDCEFVALAEALGVPLVTGDRRVLKAFPDRALSMEAFAGC